MRGREDPLGALLEDAGALSEQELSDVLRLQRVRLPLASLCYAYGLADEETLVRALARQLGVAGVVLDRSVISVDVLDGAAPELALENNVLPLAEDRHRLLVACERPDAVRDVLREMQFIKGKPVVPHVALKLTLERTLRACLRARASGQETVAGPAAGSREARGPDSIAVIAAGATVVAAEPVVQEVTKEIEFEDLAMSMQEDTAIDSSQELLAALAAVTAPSGESAPAGDGAEAGTGTEPSAAPVVGPAAAPRPVPEISSRPLVSANTAVAQIMLRGAAADFQIIDLDGRDGAPYRPFHGGPGRVLIVDDDFASRQLLAKELVPLGYQVQTAEHTGEALAHLTSEPPDAIIADVMLPEVDGFHLCRAVKHSNKYAGVAVVLVSAVIDSGQVTDEAVRRHGADAYFEKPIQADRLAARLQELMAERGAGDARGDKQTFERAMSLYRAGEIDAAVDELRRGIAEEPLSAKHHFVLANILHKKSLIFEAIDEYEATLELKPDYFPALTRLAYLYYKQGYAARAIDTWRRSLPLCADPALRQNIELFMRKLIAELGER
ncbi:MAG TPA: response regulator [Kofleriaceae bacterium]|nr:response regulator [Kofleriaceae bacterium]